MIVPGKKYTRDEIMLMRQDPDLAKVAMKGYHLRLDDDGMFSFVPYKETYSGAHERGKQRVFRPKDNTVPLFDPPGTPRRRTPVERVDSLMLKLIGDVQRLGQVPGVEDKRITEIVGEAWRSGRSEVSGEMVRRVAQHFLEKAEKENEAAQNKRVTRVGHGH